jgi:hypothetical protein
VAASIGVNNLFLLWKSAAYTHHLPAKMTSVLAALSEGYIRGAEPYSAKFFDNFADRLIERMKDGLTHTKRKELRREIVELGQHIGLTEKIQELSVEAWWDRLIHDSEIHFSMIGAISLCFCQVFFAYEAFIVDCYTLLGLDTKHRHFISGKKFWEALEAVIPRAKATYWSDGYITMARETRNCIAHRGNKAKPELLDAIEKIPEEKRIFVGRDNDISVTVGDNHCLFGVLKGKVSSLIGEVLPKL